MNQARAADRLQLRSREEGCEGNDESEAFDPFVIQSDPRAQTNTLHAHVLLEVTWNQWKAPLNFSFHVQWRYSLIEDGGRQLFSKVKQQFIFYSGEHVRNKLAFLHWLNVQLIWSQMETV